MKKKKIPYSLILALGLVFIVWVATELAIGTYEHAHSQTFRGVATTNLYINAIFGWWSLTGLTIAVWGMFSRIPGKTIAAAGQFPGYIAKAREIVQNARPGTTIRIRVDGPEHGSLADFEEQCGLHEDIKAACRRKVGVQLLLLGASARVSRANPHFDYVRDFESFRRTGGFRDFFRTYWPGLQEPDTPVEFAALMDSYMNRVLQELVDAGVKVRRLEGERAGMITSFMWSVGRRQALVARCDLQGKKPAKAHVTSEPRLVREYNAEFDRDWQTAR